MNTPVEKKLKWIPFFGLAFITLLCLFYSFSEEFSVHTFSNEIDKADTVWMLTATALVFLMTPGLAFFYGGMVNRKNVISTMLQSFISMALITVLWWVVGFSLSFGDSIGGLIGNPFTFFFMKGVMTHAPWVGAPTIPFLLFALFQLKFAIITPALITGAFSERIRFTSYVFFILLFSLFIYAPLAHATWHPNGLLFRMGVLDFAGGTVVHMSAGIAALAAALFIKKRKDTTHEPAHISYVLLGTGLLWFGWFGFNAGSTFSINAVAVNALATTTVASASAALAWLFWDSWVYQRKPSAMNVCIGAVVGLVAITPAAGYVNILHAVIIGVVSSVVSSWMVKWRTSTSIDDTLDVFPCHGVGGIMGMLLTGVFATHTVNEAVTKDGLAFGGSSLFITHLVATVLVGVFVFLGTLLLLYVVNKIIPLRVSEEEEKEGLDVSQHGESL